MQKCKSTKILLTTVCRPFGGPGEGNSVGAELFHAQVTMAQGIFSFRQVIRCWGLDYIAENIQTPSVVLHYPSLDEFSSELQNENYAYVGISFVVATFHKVHCMFDLIRKYSPETKIILGGYGTVLSDSLLEPLSDYICREEGISFMRRLLGEDESRDIRHPYAPVLSPKFYSYQRKSKVAHVTGGLGCPNGCDFCCTSHFFNRFYIPFVKTGQELYKTMRDMETKARERGDELSGFIIIDEDFFLQKRRALEFLECVRKEGKTFSIMGFGSVKGLSQFSADEIAEMGFDTIWTAFEGKESGYEKLQGKSLDELYVSLRERGVILLSSMIIGFPYQDKKRIMEEFNQLMDLKPAMVQILIYFAFPSTPYYKRVIAEDLFLSRYKYNPDYRTWDGFTMHIKHPYIAAKELEKLQKDLYMKDFEILGSSLVRATRAWFEGYKNLKNSDNLLLRQRSANFRKLVKDTFPGLLPAILFSPTGILRTEAGKLMREIYREFKPFSLIDFIKCGASILFAFWTWLAAKLDIFQQPSLLRLEYEGTPNSSTGQINEPQRSFQTNLTTVFFEDIREP